jgi:5-methylthioadenosine/S-adenosylhomocysteine deaminase
MTHLTWVRGGTVVTVDKFDRVFEGDVVFADGAIVHVGTFDVADDAAWNAPENTTSVVDAHGCIVAPGFVQAHVHVCQALFRGHAEDRALLPWLRERIWPGEAAHTTDTLQASTALGVAELLLGGTTTALDMGTVHHTDAVFRTALKMGMRLVSGKAHMDSGERPAGLTETTAASMREANRLADEWHAWRSDDAMLGYAYAPRFILSCTPELMKQVVVEARARGCMMHTHASENPGEIEAVRAMTGNDNIAALHALGMTGSDVVLAHCVWTSDAERALLRSTGTKVAHCPSTNLKLASGTAPIPAYLDSGIVVGIGADGAPCNNRLSAFTEMRLSSLLQKPILGASAMPAKTALRLMTMGGAAVLGKAHALGSIEVGKRADVIVVRTDRPHLRPRADPTTMLVYAAEASDVRDVFVEGKHVVADHTLMTASLPRILDDADAACLDVIARAGWC